MFVFVMERRHICRACGKCNCYWRHDHVKLLRKAPNDFISLISMNLEELRIIQFFKLQK